MTIVDAHVHFWDPRRIRYPWLTAFPPLNRPMLISDYNSDCGDVEVESMYFVQAECTPAQAQEEVAFVTEIAREDQRLRGMVAFAPLEQGGAARAFLESLARNPLVLGVRRMIKSEEDPDFCLRRDFIEGVRALADYGFSFALGIKAVHLLNAAKLAEQCPDVRFVLDHFAQPDIATQQLDPWRHDIQRLAKLPNVWCKLSSIATEARRMDWTPADLNPFLEHILTCWGTDRTMFATDWPVSSSTCSIPRAIEVVSALLPDQEEGDRLFRTTALKFYAHRSS